MKENKLETVQRNGRKASQLHWNKFVCDLVSEKEKENENKDLEEEKFFNQSKEEQK